MVQNKKDFVMNTACEHYGMLPHCGQLVRQRTGLITTIRSHIVAGKVFGRKTESGNRVWVAGAEGGDRGVFRQ